MNRKDLSALLLLALIWGASFLFMRIASPIFGPVVTTELRVAVAAGALLLYAGLTRRRIEIRRHWKPFLLLGGLNAALPFSLICAAELHLSASLAAILNATTPIFAALAAWGTGGERPGLTRAAGLILGLGGVGVLVGWSPEPLDKTMLYSVVFSLGAALAYGFGGLYAARVGKGVQPLTLAIGQQLGAAVWLLPLAAVFPPPEQPTLAAAWSVLGLSLVCTAFAYLLYFRLIASVGAVKTVSVTFLVPVFGMLWGVIFLHESVYLNTVAGLGIILLSIMLIGGRTRKAVGQKGA
ncbi:Permease of the drug/metabolite transporter (DMT) superfamily [Paenibacillus sophorae]|uniref:DMT family transporter n=1 Tax=Paenibacillus sophorae TaxID=1333845 RepID=A0A1H8IQE5_9BACL|nr:DMT family transporter [Paenibacillus sophorae]QWU16028.1 DMT family transporter [Paenibacillus sophorae]SEN70315.1 Permease of the drug/metabolite transporter (DMT) superfamily [Paenibacillus sophorae]